MLILALDTTTRGGSVAVTRDGELIAAIEGDPSRTHGERLPGELACALEQAGVVVRALDLLAVASGPGAFTGLRIGLAAMQGLAMVTGAPVVGVSALDALAWSVGTAQTADPDRTIVAWMDAQRGEVFSAEYGPPGVAAGDWRPRDAPIVALPAEALDALGGDARRPRLFVGDGAVAHRDAIARWSGTARVADPPGLLAPAIAAIGSRLAAGGAAGPPHALQPLYVRRPDVELERLRRGPS